MKVAISEPESRTSVLKGDSRNGKEGFVHENGRRKTAAPIRGVTDRSHALRGNASMDALRPIWDAERPGLRYHAERGNDLEGF